MNKKKVVIDFEVSGGGTVYLLIPRTEAAETWIAEHLPDDAQRHGDGIAVEHRYIDDIVNGIVDDGLVVVPSSLCEP